MYILAYALFGIILMIFIQLPIYIFYKRKGTINAKVIAVIMKGSITLVAVIYGFAGWYNAFNVNVDILPVWYNNSLWPVVGLLICMIADVVLEITFLAGMGFFFLGHICYIIYFIQLGAFPLIAIPVFIILEVIMFLYFWRYRSKVGKETPAYLLYGSLILITFSLGIFLPFTAGEMGVLPAMAAVMLVISDYILAYQIIVKRSEFREVVLLGFYWGGQYLMAMSLFLPVYM